MSDAAQGAPRAPTHPMQHGHRPAAGLAEAMLVPEAGWHCLHLFYRIDRGALARLDPVERDRGRLELAEILGAPADEGIAQRQSYAVIGHKADFGLIAAGPDLRAIHAIQVNIAASRLGPVLHPAYSFYSLTEVSEYVPDSEQYAKTLREREGMDPESPAYRTKVAQYANRLEGMNRQRLYPEFPDWPCLVFYPMSKTRLAGQNWYTLPFADRSDMMAEHGRSGMKFAGRVTQLVTASTGVDDWEWGVTLWARNPQYLREIVYSMRFDEASAKYALFGSFYFGYVLPPAELIAAVRL